MSHRPGAVARALLLATMHACATGAAAAWRHAWAVLAALTCGAALVAWAVMRRAVYDARRFDESSVADQERRVCGGAVRTFTAEEERRVCLTLADASVALVLIYGVVCAVLTLTTPTRWHASVVFGLFLGVAAVVCDASVAPAIRRRFLRQ